MAILLKPPRLLAKCEYAHQPIGSATYHEVRDEYVKTSWTILTHEVAVLLAAYIGKRKTLDAGAGTGYMSAHLEQLGATNITASDIGGEMFSKYGMSQVYKRDHEGDSCSLLPGDFEVVILSWPPYNKPFGFLVAEKMKPGSILIYNGEGDGGNTGDDVFHYSLDIDFELQEEITDNLNNEHVRFSGINDRWHVYKKHPMVY